MSKYECWGQSELIAELQKRDDNKMEKTLIFMRPDRDNQVNKWEKPSYMGICDTNKQAIKDMKHKIAYEFADERTSCGLTSIELQEDFEWRYNDVHKDLYTVNINI